MSGRIRTIKPEILEDAVVAGLTSDAFRLFVGSFVLADDYGVFRAEPAFLQGQIFWKRPSIDPIEDAISQLSTKLILFYEVDGQRYGFIRSWEKHQKVSHRGRRRLPAPPEALQKPSGDPPEGLRSDHRPHIIDHRPHTIDRAEPVGSGVCVLVSSTPPKPETDDDAPESTKSMRRAAREGEYRKAYAAGILEGGGGKIALLSKHQGDLNSAIEVFARDDAGKAYRGDELLAWVRCFAADFAEDIVARSRDKPEARNWYSSLFPAGFSKWLSERSQAQMARAIP